MRPSFQLALIVLCLIVATSALSSRQSDFTFGGYFAKQRPWTDLLAGQTGAKGNTQPRRIHHTACGAKYFVAWTERRSETPNAEFPNNYDEVTVGHITQFSVSAQGVPTLVRDVVFEACNEMGNIYCSPDGTIVAALCQSAQNSVGGAPTVDFVAKNRDATGNAPFGWDQTSQPNPRLPNYKIVNNMFLLEFSTGQITPTPSASVRVNHAIGGWAYGHYEVQLNAAKNLYFISMKTTIFGGGLWHEGSVSFEMTRGTWTLNSPSSWACGGGHVMSNRAVYNPILNKFALFCKTDLSSNNGGPNAAYYSTDIRTKAVQIQSYPNRDEPRIFWHGNGGPMNLVPTPNGFLGSGLGPGGAGKPITIGIINLPGNHSNFRPETSSFRWIDIPNTFVDNSVMPASGLSKIGYPNLAPIGRTGAQYLLGWAIMDTATSKRHQVAQIDKYGCLLTTVLSIPGGWGQDDVWSYSPVSGCVLMPYVWRDDSNSSAKYGDCTQCNPVVATSFSKKLRITTVCPTTTTTPSCRFIPASRNAAVADDSSSLNSLNNNNPAQSTVNPWVWAGVGVGVVALVVVVVVVVVINTRESKKEETV